MTLHSAKGLEFDAVFLVGMEEGLLPHSRTMESDEEVEEERRLCYVGMTRARRLLHMTAASRRRLYGEPMNTQLSRFLDEIGDEQLQKDLSRIERFTRPAPIHVRRETALGEEDIDWPVDDGEEGSFRVGARVRHANFGIGEVLQVEPARGGQKLTVKFPGGRIRKLMTPYARLTAVQLR
jgi:DNA helicase-2/ATP-dependent DNA helicase PcrA